MLKETLDQAVKKLTNSTSPKLDAELLLAHILQKPRSYLFAHNDLELDQNQVCKFKEILARRVNGEPLAYITGKKEFWSLELDVNPDVLIPRPETELLVELALKFCGDKDKISCVDLGTGSGAIALAIASERPGWKIFATDIDDKVLKVAQANADKLGIKNVNFFQGNWIFALPNDLMDVIISNPPYVEFDDQHLEGNIRFEPQKALVAKDAGLAHIKQIITQAWDSLNDNGVLILEHGYEQGEGVRRLLRQHKYYAAVVTYFDLAGLERATVAIKKQES